MRNKIIEILRFILAVFVYIFGISKIRKNLLRRTHPLVRVLLIHHIKNIDNFERMLSFLSKNYNVISFNDFVSGNFSNSKINVLLTLDDGYESWVKVGFESLKKFSFPAVFFVSSGFSQSLENNTWESFCKSNLLLKWVSKPIKLSDLKNLSSLVEVGGHTISHPFLTQIDSNKQFEEVNVDKDSIQNNIDKEVRVFAYPFGNYNKNVVDVVKSAGYKFAMTTDSDFYRPDHYTNLEIPRSNHGTVSNFVLKMWVEGAFDIAFRIQYFFSNLLK